MKNGLIARCSTVTNNRLYVSFVIYVLLKCYSKSGEAI